MADKKKETVIVAKYKKGSGFLNGIPARDLTAVDWHNLSTDQKLQVKNSPMYTLKIPFEEPATETPDSLVKGDKE